MRSAVSGQTQVRRPKTAHWSGTKTQNLQPQRQSWHLSNSHSKGASVSSVTVDPTGCQNEQDRLPSADCHNPKSPHTSPKHLKATCRCLQPRREMVSFCCLDEEVARETEDKRSSSAQHDLTNGSGGELPWYLTVIHEKEQSLLKLSKEVSRLSEFEWQCSRKDHEISVLEKKLAEVTNQHSFAHNDEVVKAQAEVILRLSKEIQHLHKAEQEALEKGPSLSKGREEIQRVEQPGPQCATRVPKLRDTQSTHIEVEHDMPQNTCPASEPENFGSLVSVAEHKRDQDECQNDDDNDEKTMTKKTLMQQLEDTKKNYMISTGTVCSLRRTLSIKDRELTSARAQVEELQQELRDRMAQLQAMSRKFSCRREGKANEELTAALETENYALRQLTAQLKEEAFQKVQAAEAVRVELQQLQRDLAMERDAQAKLKRQEQANREIIATLHQQHSRAKVSLEQVQTRFERLRVKIIQAAYSAPGAKQPQIEISDAALLQTLQKIIDDRTAFHQRLQQKGEKMPPLTTADTQSVKSTAASAKN